MRCFMRQSNIPTKALRLAVSPFVAVPVVAVFVCSSPAFAHSHFHSHWARSHRSGRVHAYAHAHIYRNATPTYGFASYGGLGVYPPAASGFGGSSSMAAAQASASGVPASLIDRVIRRESGGNARAVHAGNYGLMQIKLSTARAMGYTGSAAGLLDPQTNMTYAVRYLAGAYRAAGGDESRAVALYSRGYYYQAKAQGFSPYASGMM
jgi:soluble lytic murein transglycosylase-like protein